MRSAWIPTGLLFLLVAALWLGLVSPLTARLPADYASQVYFDASTRARQTPDSAWERLQLVGRRLDSTLMTTDERSIIESDVYWALPDGRLYFENAGIYAVDRDSRRNLGGLGNISRDGHFMFPTDVSRDTFRLWDSQFAGPRMARFAGVDTFAGFTVFRFAFKLRALDETIGYSHLPDVPERFDARTDGEGLVTVEPRSGVVLDYTERGRSYFVDAAGTDRGGLFEWNARFTEQTRQVQLAHARGERRRLLLARYVVPSVLAALGLALLLAGAVHERRRRA